MLPTDIALLPTLGRPTLSPDGRFAVLDVTTVLLAEDDYASHLMLVDTSGRTPARRLTEGPSDGAPAFSPDGSWLAFLRPVPQGRSQVHLLDMAAVTAGEEVEPRVVTSNLLGAGQPVWSPDSARIAYASRIPAPGRYRGAPEAEPPRRITTLTYVLDDFGYTFDRPRQIFVIDPFTDEPSAGTQLTSGEYDHGDLSWSPDSELLAFVTGRHETHSDDSRRDVWVCRPDGADLRPLTHGGMYLFGTRLSSDGTVVYFSGAAVDENNHSTATSSYGLWAVPVNGSTGPRRLTDDRFHLSFASQLILPAPEGVYFAADHRGEVNLILVPHDGGEPIPVITGNRQVNGYAVATTTPQPTVVAVVATEHSAGDLIVTDAAGERALTFFGRELEARAELMAIHPFTATTDDDYVLQGWVVRPPGPGPHPVILQIKGGPFTQFGYTLSGPAALDEAQVYASAGFAVVLGNPRGCSGYGQAHASHVQSDLPRRSAPDLLALLDAALAAHPELDGSRVGMMGGSFGGYMSAWMNAHHNERFRAAIGERGLYAIDSYSATSDDGVDIAVALYGPDRKRWPEMSPLTYVGQMRLPMMIIQSEEDRHCPMEQAQRLFTELRLLGVPAEMLLFPGEGHDMSRTGLPSHRVARFDAVLEWWSRHLRSTAPTGGSPAGASAGALGPPKTAR
jgi:dipeptidyl aminopeptidase/acylaminoacyl peptidase